MSEDKKYTPREAALQVLKKAEEMLLAKADGCWDGYKHTPGTKKGDKGSCEPMSKDDGSGVHEANHEGPGSSFAGSMSRAAVKGNTSLPKEKLNSEAKSAHKKVLAEIKSMPKPNLTKDEEGSNEEMAHLDVTNLADKAEYLHKLMDEMGNQKDAPAWVIEKMGQAKAHLQDVMDYIKGQSHRDIEKSEAKMFPKKAKKSAFKKDDEDSGDTGMDDMAMSETENSLSEEKGAPKEQVIKDNGMRLEVSPENNKQEQKEEAGSWGDEKGYIKLAKWCGHMDAKRKMKSSN